MKKRKSARNITKKELALRIWQHRRDIIGIVVEEVLLSVGILRKPTQWLEDADGHLIMTIK